MKFDWFDDLREKTLHKIFFRAIIKCLEKHNLEYSVKKMKGKTLYIDLKIKNKSYLVKTNVSMVDESEMDDDYIAVTKNIHRDLN